MSKSASGEPNLSEVTGSFHYQELIESRLGQPIAPELSIADAEKLARSPGAKLAAGRVALGWSIQDVAFRLKMAPRQITALETDDYQSLPEPAIVRGFVRAYAKLLKLDPASVIALLAFDEVKKPATSSRDRSASNSSNERKKSLQQNNNVSLKIWLAILVAGILLLAWVKLVR